MNNIAKSDSKRKKLMIILCIFIRFLKVKKLFGRFKYAFSLDRKISFLNGKEINQVFEQEEIKCLIEYLYIRAQRDNIIRVCENLVDRLLDFRHVKALNMFNDEELTKLSHDWAYYFKQVINKI